MLTHRISRRTPQSCYWTEVLHYSKISYLRWIFRFSPDKSRTGYYGVCPVCRSQNCFIGTNGKAHLVYWKCLDKTGVCASTQPSFKTPRNLLSLAKFILGSQAVAFRVISHFLGFGDRPFDITNGKVGLSDGYTFLVGNDWLNDRLFRAGLYVSLYDGDLDKPELRRKVIVIVMDEEAEALAEVLRASGCEVAVYSPSSLNGLRDHELKTRAVIMVRRTMAGVPQK